MFNKNIFERIFEYFNNNQELFREEWFLSKSVYNDIYRDEHVFWRRVFYNYYRYQLVARDNYNTDLDYGSGWGFFCFCLSGFGVKNVIGIEVDKKCFELATRIKQDLFPEKEITFINSGILDIKNEVDVIFFDNVISHVKLPIEYLYKAYSVLRYSGSIYIIDSNNGLQQLVKLRNKKLWKRDEKGLITERANFLKDLGVKQQEIEKLSYLSRGLGKEDIAFLISDYNKNKDISLKYLQEREDNLPSQYLSPPITNERIINPLIYKKILLDLGFECIKIRSVSLNHVKLANILNKLKLGLYFLPSFLIVAEKRRVP